MEELHNSGNKDSVFVLFFVLNFPLVVACSNDISQ